MRALRWVGIGIIVYAGIVTAFESLIGYFQPANAQTLVISTTDEDGETRDRVLARLETGGSIYVSANHWPRAWYRRALANPAVGVTIAGEKQEYVAVPVEDASEHDRVEGEHPHSIVFRILTGFPPRYFLRLDPNDV